MLKSVLPRLPGQTQTTWSNWAGNQNCSPTKVLRPLDESQLQDIVKSAAANGQRVRAVGSGHSFTATACSDDIMISLEHLNMVRSIDTAKHQITVQAGIDLKHMNTRLAKAGLAMTNLGDIAYQTAAGATSTGTHGTGLAFQGLAAQIQSLRLVDATGSIIECSADDNADLFRVARVGLGVFGIITEMTIQVEPAFNLHAIERAEPLDQVLDNWQASIAEHDHYEFFWIPGTDQAMTKSNRRTQDALNPSSKVKHFADKIIGENVGFGAITKLAKLRPSIIPKLRDVVTSSVSDAEYTDKSYKVFASPRWVKFVEMEYSVPVADVPQVLRRIDAAVADAGIELLFPIEVRAAAADDIALSTANGRDSGYIAVHRYKGADFTEYFELVEAIMDDFDGRPHWGKMHFQTATTLAPRYPEWDAFQDMRRRYDPTGVFSNDYTDRVLDQN